MFLGLKFYFSQESVLNWMRHVGYAACITTSNSLPITDITNRSQHSLLLGPDIALKISPRAIFQATTASQS